MPSEDIDNYIESLQLENSIIDNQNTQLEILRNCSVKQLKTMLNEADSYFNSENIGTLKELVQEELKARSLFGKAQTVYLNLKYKAKMFPQLCVLFPTLLQ
jgi:hypothetical protein